METIGVIGAGAWGTALAQVMAKGGRDVTIWAREDEVVRAINDTNENTVFLPGVALDPALKATDDLDDVSKRDVVLLVSPAQHVRTMCEQIKDSLGETTQIVLCSKGIELDSGLLLSQVFEQVFEGTDVIKRFAVLTGPTFASEIAQGLPSAVTLAAKTESLGYALQDALAVKHFRPYVTTDMIGAQLGGAIKNVIAIACGLVTGRGLGESARAALLTRGVAEIARLAVAMGADRLTLLGMCGIGDLMLTCSSMQSRNFSLGFALGEGETSDQVLGTRKAVTEGVHTAGAALQLAKSFAVDMPITEAVHKILTTDMPIEEAIEDMLNRPFKYKLAKTKRRHGH